MTDHDADLERLTTLLGQCLGRIDEQAYHLQQNPDEDDFEASDVLERETALLQEIISSVVDRTSQSEDADLNLIVGRALNSCVVEFDQPVVAKTRLAHDLPRITCAPGQLAFAVQRALLLVLGAIESGGTVTVTTRLEGGEVLLEIETNESVAETHFGERSMTLRDFVEGLGGRCRGDSDGRGTCLIAIQLPTVLVRDDPR